MLIQMRLLLGRGKSGDLPRAAAKLFTSKLLTRSCRWPTGYGRWACFVPQAFMFRGRGFCCLASLPPLPRAFNSTFPPGAATGVPQLRRFRGLTTQWRERVLLCRDAFAAFISYCLLRYCGADSMLESLSAGYVDSADDKIC